MKKIIILFLVMTTLLLSACGNPIIEIPLEIPDGEDVVFPIDEPEQEVEPVVEVDEEPDVEPEIIIEIIERFIDVPAEIEMMRKYTPGTYFSASQDVNPSGGYSFVVVVIDAYGDIAGVHIDETFSSRVLYTDSNNVIYTFIEGDGVSIPNTYRIVDKDLAYKNYPTITDAITTDDLIQGIHSETIKLLKTVQVNETKFYLNGDLQMGGVIDYKSQIDLIVKKIIQDNTTYGFNLYASGNQAKTDSIAGVSINVSDYLGLVQNILDSKAKITADTVLADISNPSYGLYTQGTYIDYSDHELEDESLNFGFSITVVDDFGVIAGIYLDETFDNKILEGSFSTKGIMKDIYGVSALGGFEWDEQVERLSMQIIDNQGIDGLNIYNLNVLGDKNSNSIKTSGDEELYTDSIAGVSVRIDRVTQAVKKSLTRAKFTDYLDGVYFVNSDDGLFSVITINDSQIEDIYLDRLKSVFQAQYNYLGEEYGLFKFVRSFSLGETNVSKALMVYEKDGLYYSPVELQELQGIELSNSQDLNKDEEIELSSVELASLVVVPGNYTAEIAENSEYVNLDGWKVNNDLLIKQFVKDNGTHTVLLDGGDYIIDEDILYYDVSNVISLINEGLYSARTGGFTFGEVGSNTSNLLSDGEFFVSLAPNTRGEIIFGYMNIINGNINTLYFDSTISIANGTTTEFIDSNEEDGSWRSQIILFIETVINNQGYIINTLLDDYEYYDEDTIKHIGDDNIFKIQDISIELEEYIHVFELLIDESVNNKLNTDAKYINDFLLSSETYFKDLYFLTHQILPNFLPNMFVGSELTNEYELEWISSNTRDLDLNKTLNGYDVEIDDDITEDKEITLTMVVRLPGGDQIIDSFDFTFDIMTRYSEGVMLLNDLDFKLPASFMLEDTTYSFPTMGQGKIKWKSSKENVISSSGEAYGVNQNTDVTLVAYVDIDGNGSHSTGEPSKNFYVSVLTTENAIKRVRDSIELSNIYQYIDRDFTLSNKSPVWGVTYEWKVFSPFITLTDQGTHTDVSVVRVGYDVNVTFTADINIGSSNNDVNKQIKILEGNKGVYEEYSKVDLNEIEFEQDLINLIVGDDLNFDELLVGSLRKSDITFDVSDFGMFIDSDGLVIANHSTKDAEFTITALSEYDAGSEAEVIKRVWNIRIISAATINEYVISDKEELVDYAIDLSHNSHLDVQLNLPTEGFVHNSTITWTIFNSGVLPIEKFDTTELSEGIIRILTKTGTLTLEELDSFILTAEISIGDISVTKNINVQLRD